MRLKIASLAILGAAAIGISALASPAMAEGKMAKGTKSEGTMAEGTMAKGKVAKGTMAKGAKYARTETMGSQKLAKGQRHATYSKRIRSANAALPGGRAYRRSAGPVETAGNIAGGAVATAGAIATAPFRAFDNTNYNNSYNNYYGYGYGGRDWKTYAAHNSLACTPGTMFKGPDGKRHLCQ